MINININLIKAICPFCRKHITAEGIIIRNIVLTENQKLLRELLSNRINYMRCPECGESFYYENDCLALNTSKNYAVASLPMQNAPDFNTKASIFTILNKDNFRFRYVNEFIYLSEKVRIFEFDLDDRVLEVIKYKYLAMPMNMDADSKIILTGTEFNTLVFTVFDDYDKPVAKHHVSSDAYTDMAFGMDKEIVNSPYVLWQKIDLKWAEHFVKENTK